MSNPSSSIGRRSVLLAAGVTGVAAGLTRFGVVWANEGPQSYTPSWSSVDQHPPAPEWFQDAKLGIYFHWGLFSVPAFISEWYPRNMYNNGSPENNHHKQVYGDPSVWPYHNFINGARDKAANWVQFAPKLRSAGGNFDPDAWAQLFVDAGANFAGPVAEHHDGYSIWNSSVNEWNAVHTGPRLDLVGLHANAIRVKGLKFTASLHRVGIEPEAVELGRFHEPAVGSWSTWVVAGTGLSTAPTGWWPTVGATPRTVRRAARRPGMVATTSSGGSTRWATAAIRSSTGARTRRWTAWVPPAPARRRACGFRTATPTTNGPSPRSDHRSPVAGPHRGEPTRSPNKESQP
jgi:hypothetical protein